jgi:hypothetical protein
MLLVAALLPPICIVNARAASGAAANAAESVSDGYSEAALFNQANACARQGRVGPAILNYERALMLAPADADVAANLHFVRAKAGLPDVQENGPARSFESVRPNTLAWLGCLGLTLAGLSLLLLRCFPRHHMACGLMTFVGALLVAATVGSAVLMWPKVHEAVILAGEVPARISPAAFAVPAFKLREGEIVTVQSEHNGFLLVRTPAGRSGWVAGTDLGLIVTPGSRG